MRRAKKGKNIIITILFILCILSASVFGYVKMKELKVDTQEESIEEPTFIVDNVPEKQTSNKGVEIVSVDEDATLDQSKDSSINASKQSSLEKAIDDLMNQTETE